MVITRRGTRAVALAADELESLMETAYLLRAPKNARRLLEALRRALAQTEPPRSMDQLRAEMGLAPKAP